MKTRVQLGFEKQNNHFSWHLRLLKVAFASLFAASASVNAQNYIFTDLGTLGGTISDGLAINSAGQVVGYSYTAGNAGPRATLWSGNTAIALGTTGPYTYAPSVATAINNLGQIAGYTAYAGDSAMGQGMVWNGATVTALSSLNGVISAANGINSAGKVVGSVTIIGYTAVFNTAVTWSGFDATPLDGSGSSVAYGINSTGQVTGQIGAAGINGAPISSSVATVWSGNNLTILNTLGGRYSAGLAINDAGQVAGYSTENNTGNLRAVVWNGINATELDTLGGVGSQANAINNAGQVVGSSNTVGNAAKHATLWNGSTVTDLNSFLSASTIAAGWRLTSANGINDNGWITGRAFNSLTGSSDAFILSVAVVPEPESYIMMLAGLCVIGVGARHRKRATR